MPAAIRHTRRTNRSDDAAIFFDQGRRSNSDWLGFWPHEAIHDYILRGGFWHLEENGDIVAAAVVGSRYPTLKVHAIYTRPDARRFRFAMELLDAIQAHGRALGCHRLRARVAGDLPDLPFWAAAGFQVARVTQGGNRRRRPILHLVREPDGAESYPLFAMRGVLTR